MAFDRFMIGPFESGLQTNLRKFLIPEDAFTTLQNAYVFRGRVRKRFGSTLMDPSSLNSRLRIQVGTIGVPVSPVPVGNRSALGQGFSAGSQFFTVWQTGTPASMLATGPGTGTYNTTTGAFALAGTGLGAGTPIYYYPALPVMGLTQFEVNQINNHPSYAFDQRRAYLYTGGSGWDLSQGSPTWQGNNLNFFWTTNYQGIPQAGGVEIQVLFVTNFQVKNPNGISDVTDDPIYYGFSPAGGVAITTWVSTSARASNVNAFYFLPAPGTPPVPGPRVQSAFVQSAKIILPFKDRLLLLNTIENDNSTFGTTPGTGTNTNYVNRCRYSWNGSPFATNAWYEPGQSDNTGLPLTGSAAGGDYIDAATDEQIVSAEFIKDRLIVYFERSTWEIIYTQSEVTPFRWQKINTELGSQSTFSTVPFDTAVLTIGQSGIHQCSGANVSRIDEKIPDEIFDNFEITNNATLRTCGIRDYYTELVYWAFVQSNQDDAIANTFPNQVLVYNYKSGSWALNDDTITAFGYFEQSTDITWASSAPTTWAQFSGTWSSNFLNAQERQIIAGTPEGFIFIVNADENSNAQSMQITQAIYAGGIMTLTIYNHNFSDGDFINIFNLNGITITNPTTPIFKISYVDVNTVTIAYIAATGVYTGGGTASRVSNIQIETKQWNPYMDKDRNFFLQRIDFMVAKTNPDPTTGVGGQITVDYYPSSSDQSMIEAGNTTGAIMGNSVLETTPYNPIYYPLEQFQERLAHPIYFQTTGNVIELFMFLSDEQMINPLISLAKFELESMILYTSPTSDRMQ